MKKKLPILLFCVLLTLTAAFTTGCSKNSGPQNQDEQSSQPESETPEAQPADEETAQPEQDGSQQGTQYPVTVTDSLGNEVTIEKYPERIVSLSPSSTEILFAIGAGERIKGRTDYCSYPAEAAQIESIGTYTSPNTELIISMEPDIIFASDYMDDSIRQQVEAVGAKVIVFAANDYSSIKNVILLAGQALDLNENAAQVVSSMDTELAELKESVASVQEKKTVFVDLGSFYSAGTGSLLDDVLNQIGAENIAADTGKTWPQFSVEAIIEKNPDIYLSLYPTPEELKNTAGIGELDCIKNDQIIFFEALSPEGDIIQRPGPRIVEGMKVLAEKIYPDLF